MSTLQASDLRKAAAAAFGDLTIAYKQGDAPYWQLGHFFDTALDYFAIAPGAAAQWGDYACTNFTAKTSGDQWPNYWYDDHGWWGIASLRAAQHPEWFGSRTSDFQQIAQRTWDTMNAMAPTVWDRRPDSQGPDPFHALQPRFTPGVWNFSWSKDPTKLPGCDPGADSLCGIQNTVTNVLYLQLASRRYLVTKDDACRDAATSEYGFLDQWFDATLGDDALLDRLTLESSIVRERVSTYLSGQRVPGYEVDKAWVGDQGLTVGALVAYAQMLGSGAPPVLLDLARGILVGTLGKFFSDGKLNPWIPSDQSWQDDYLTGPAAFFRNVLHVYGSSPQMKTWLGDPKTGYPAFIRTCAESAALQPSGDDMISRTNDLAALVAGITML